MTIGAEPSGNEFQKTSFNIKNIKAVTILRNPIRIPENAAILIGTLE